jgi:tRNA pseudouridine55 synthase
VLGILLVDKPKGLTSHDVVNRIRRKFSTKRVGHAGTLDPLATGLLVVAVGPATRFLQYLPLEPKVYEAQITFGQSSTTYDAEGEMTPGGPVPADLASAVTEILPRFTGLISQMPPMFSAIKVQGQALYKYARMGKEIEREPRTVHIGELVILGSTESELRVHVECSGGTYIRSLAHDLGEALGCGAYLSGLVRTRVGRFTLEDATSLDLVEPAQLLSLKDALPPMPLVEVDAVSTQHIREGRAIGLNDPPEGVLVGLIEPRGQVFSIARVHGNVLQPECVIPSGVIDGNI